MAKTLVHAFISCCLDYCNSLLYGIADGQLQRLQSLQNAAARLVSGSRRSEHITPILKSLHCLPVRQRVTFKLATLVHKCLNGRAPAYTSLTTVIWSPVVKQDRFYTASLDVPRTSTSFGDRTFGVAGPCVWKYYHYHS